MSSILLWILFSFTWFCLQGPVRQSKTLARVWYGSWLSMKTPGILESTMLLSLASKHAPRVARLWGAGSGSGSDHWGSSRIPKSQSSCLLSRPGCRTCRKQECSLPLPFKFLLLLDLCWDCGITVPENLNTECRAPDKESEAVGEGHSLNCLISNPFLQLFFIQSSNETEPMAPSWACL